LEQLGRPPSIVQESGVMKSETLIEYRKLADDPASREKLIENLNNLLGGLAAFEGRETNIQYYLEHRDSFH
jgi:hypothetical protein